MTWGVNLFAFASLNLHVNMVNVNYPVIESKMVKILSYRYVLFFLSFFLFVMHLFVDQVLIILVYIFS